MTRELYPFRFKDPVTGKWIRARYRARLADIASRYATFEITGPAAIPAAPSSGFDPHRKLMTHAELARRADAPVELDPPLPDALERTLVQAFLRRYVTWCARSGRYAQMNGAARLLRAIGETACPAG
jgi:hypothetical protein